MVKIALASYRVEPVGSAFNYKLNAINSAYTNAILKAGAIPVIIPYINPECALEALEGFSGLVIPGGEDVTPSLYNEECTYSKKSDLESDLYDIALIKAARELKIPMLGICRGAQLINVERGGTLYQDIEKSTGSSIHTRLDKPYEGVHNVKLVEGTLLSKLFGTNTLRVNSLHHQGVKVLGEGLSPLALADDNLVEAFSGERTLGIQWHPEAMESFMSPIFSYFIKEAENV